MFLVIETQAPRGAGLVTVRDRTGVTRRSVRTAQAAARNPALPLSTLATFVALPDHAGWMSVSIRRVQTTVRYFSHSGWRGLGLQATPGESFGSIPRSAHSTAPSTMLRMVPLPRCAVAEPRLPAPMVVLAPPP